MDLHHRIALQACGGALQIGQGGFAVAAQMADPAIGVHEGRHRGFPQPPRDGLGPGHRLGIVGFPRRQQAGEVVGHDDRAGILTIQVVIDGDGPVDIALAFQKTRLGPQQIGIVGQRRQPLVHRCAGSLGVVLLAVQPHQRQIGARILRVLGDQIIQTGAGGRDVAGGGLGHRLNQKDAGIVGIFGHQIGSQLACPLHVARGQTRPDQPQLRALIRIGPVGQPFQIGHRGILTVRCGDPVQVQFVGGGLGLGAVDLAQLRDHALSARQVGHLQIDPAQQCQQVEVLRVLFQRRDQRILGRAPAALIGKRLRQTQAGTGRPVRGLGRLRQIVAGQIGLARAGIGGGHQPHRLGILGVLVQHVAQIQQRRIGVVILDRPAGLQLQRRGMAGIGGKDGVDLGLGARHIAGLDQHLRQLRADVAGAVAGFDPLQQAADPGDGLVAAPGIEIEPRLQHPEDQRIAPRLERLVDLGQGGLVAAMQLDKADQVGARGGVVHRRGIGQSAHEILGLVGLVLRQVEPDQIGLGIVVVGKAVDGGQKLRLGPRHVALFHQQRQPLAIAQAVVGLQVQQFLDQRSGPVQIVVPSRLVQRHAEQDHVIGTLCQQGPDLGGDGFAGRILFRLAGLAIAHRQIEDMDIGIVWGQFHRPRRVAFEFIQIAAVEGHPGQRDPDRQIVGILFGQTQILAVGAAQIALFHQRLGQGLAGLVMGALDIEDIAELDDGAVRIARGQQIEAGLVIFRRLFFRGFAACQRQGQTHQQGRRQDQPPGRSGTGSGLGPGGTGNIIGNHGHLVVGTHPDPGVPPAGRRMGASVTGAAKDDTERADQDPQIQPPGQIAVIRLIIAHARHEFRFISRGNLP